MPHPRARRRAFIAPLAAAYLTLLLLGCVPPMTLPPTCGDAVVTFSTTLAGDRLEPAVFNACRDQEVTIRVIVERDGILHLHGYDDLLGAQEVRAGQAVELSFRAAHVGQFPIALHPREGSAELTVGTLVVHDA